MRLLSAAARRYDAALWPIDRRRLLNSRFSLIANDCWAGAVYQRVGIQYQSPFVGLWIMAQDYIELLANPLEVLTSPLTFGTVSRHESVNQDRQRRGLGYPIGVLARDVELQMIHYTSQSEARSKWERRRGRLDMDNLFVKFDGSKDGARAAERARFDNLSFSQKVMFVRQECPERSAVTVPRWTNDAQELLRTASPVFDVVDWLNGGSGRLTSGAGERLRKFALFPASL